MPAIPVMGINTPKSFMCQMMQTKQNHPINIKSPWEIAMGFTIPTISIGAILYIALHFLLGGIFN